MTIVALEQGAKLHNPTNVLTLDIERLPGRFEGDFWDLNGFKGRRIHPDMVLEWPRTILVCWQWYGTKTVEAASEWTDGRENMLRRVWEVVDKADYVIGHNVERFDVRKLNTEWRDLNMWQPTPPKMIDTLKEARKVFGDESFTLDALCKRTGVISKTDKYDPEVAKAACNGDTAAQKRITAYCKGDVRASKNFVDRLRGWLPNHPHNLMGTADDRPTCNQCWGDNLSRNGIHLAQQITYLRWRCQDCGANVQSSRHSRAAITRGAR